ncbi:uncharacterized protein BO96DRAFT_434450 [Aspergillus niger CBS 101883]|uniref:uncharacterized protein n=1 Tax=Aspergillus lacticoffeatus (strain CBS 101883) TaxID=1450533 RepID=UPI000D7FB5A9|nr:uncharacterized protein BO96DRAFT_434450 [Aspergillus niger CBS 101883]PYH56472.1 hypothetical protein BO96DRAFT_434450 [Aspergillus niger CBS 101883]
MAKGEQGPDIGKNGGGKNDPKRMSGWRMSDGEGKDGGELEDGVMAYRQEDGWMDGWRAAKRKKRRMKWTEKDGRGDKMSIWDKSYLQDLEDGDLLQATSCKLEPKTPPKACPGKAHGLVLRIFPREWWGSQHLSLLSLAEAASTATLPSEIFRIPSGTGLTMLHGSSFHVFFPAWATAKAGMTVMMLLIQIADASCHLILQMPLNGWETHQRSFLSGNFHCVMTKMPAPDNRYCG